MSPAVAGSRDISRWHCQVERTGQATPSYSPTTYCIHPAQSVFAVFLRNIDYRHKGRLSEQGVVACSMQLTLPSTTNETKQSLIGFGAA